MKKGAKQFVLAVMGVFIAVASGLLLYNQLGLQTAMIVAVVLGRLLLLAEKGIVEIWSR